MLGATTFADDRLKRCFFYSLLAEARVCTLVFLAATPRQAPTSNLTIRRLLVGLASGATKPMAQLQLGDAVLDATGTCRRGIEIEADYLELFASRERRLASGLAGGRLSG